DSPHQTAPRRRTAPAGRRGGPRRSAQRDRAGGTREPGDRGIAPFPSLRRVRAIVRAGAARDHQEMPHGVGMDKGTAPRADRGMDQTTTQTSLKGGADVRNDETKTLRSLSSGLPPGKFLQQ